MRYKSYRSGKGWRVFDTHTGNSIGPLYRNQSQCDIARDRANNKERERRVLEIHDKKHGTKNGMPLGNGWAGLHERGYK